MGQLIGALLGTFLISRLFWVATKKWPDSIGKAIFLNVVCALIIIPLDYSVRDGANLGEEILLYGMCQVVVFVIDVVWLGRRAPASG
jgi:hypothetical protein